MSGVTASVDVRVPVRTAYSQWTQFESFPEFLSGVTEIRQIDDRHTHWVTDVAGAHREFDAEIVEQRPDECVSWRSTGGEVRHSGIVTFEPLAPDQTRIHVDLDWEPDGLVEKAGSVLGIDHRQVKSDLERFKEFIEERGTATGRWPGQLPAPGSAATQVPASSGPMGDGISPPDDIVDVLLAQHTQAKELLNRAATASTGERSRCFEELAAFLTLHEKAEQQVVHPVTRASGGRGEQTAEGRVHEEHDASQLVAAIRAAGFDAPDYLARLEELRQAVLAHAEHEETEEFPKLRRDVPPERLREMAEDFLFVQLSVA